MRPKCAMAPPSPGDFFLRESHKPGYGLGQQTSYPKPEAAPQGEPGERQSRFAAELIVPPDALNKQGNSNQYVKHHQQAVDVLQGVEHGFSFLEELDTIKRARKA